MQKQKEELKKKRGKRGERRDAQDRRIIYSYCGTSLVKKNFSRPRADASGGEREYAFGTFSRILINYIAYSSQNLNSAL